MTLRVLPVAEPGHLKRVMLATLRPLWQGVATPFLRMAAALPC